jgi:hypothetical protein
MTKAKLIKSNERKNVVIFMLLVLSFVLAITGSCYLVQIKESNDKILKNTNEIIGILTIGEENGD